MAEGVRAALADAIAQRQPLIAVHRGSSAGTIMPNTISAGKAAVLQGADIVELDVARSLDGEYFTFHDTYEPFLLGERRLIGEMTAAEIDDLIYYASEGSAAGHVERYSETLSGLHGVIINVDRSYRYWEQGFLEELATWSDPDYLLIKSDPLPGFLNAVGQCGTRFPYMAVVRNEHEIHTAIACSEGGNVIDLVGFEILAEHESDSVLHQELLLYLKEQGYALWFNSINLENARPLCAGYDDVTSLFVSPDLGWGKLIDLGADVIQTDWPAPLKSYLRRRSL
ncbi:glycerophosphodiester phosphodiesterase family protein [Trueperella pyogenes]|uniref:glycerophosphodiester phosphodiesterase family protein n=1 Tax=Trueperella pyogenes TaxID=1661 RepID=UPI003248C4ED